MNKLFKFQLTVGGEPAGDSGVISINQSILDEGLSKEFKDVFYDLEDEAGVAAHLAWQLLVNDYQSLPERIEGWNIKPGQVFIVQYPQGWNDYGCEAEEL